MFRPWYESAWKEALLTYKDRGIESVVFGDLFLEDIKKYREDQLKGIGMECIFPIWKRDTVKLAADFIDMGFKVITVCVDSKFLGKEFPAESSTGNFSVIYLLVSIPAVKTESSIHLSTTVQSSKIRLNTNWVT